MIASIAVIHHRELNLPLIGKAAKAIGCPEDEIIRALIPTGPGLTFEDLMKDALVFPVESMDWTPDQRLAHVEQYLAAQETQP